MFSERAVDETTRGILVYAKQPELHAGSVEPDRAVPGRSTDPGTDSSCARCTCPKAQGKNEVGTGTTFIFASGERFSGRPSRRGNGNLAGSADSASSSWCCPASWPGHRLPVLFQPPDRPAHRPPAPDRALPGSAGKATVCPPRPDIILISGNKAEGSRCAFAAPHSGRSSFYTAKVTDRPSRVSHNETLLPRSN